MEKRLLRGSQDNLPETQCLLGGQSGPEGVPEVREGAGERPIRPSRELCWFGVPCFPLAPDSDRKDSVDM